MTTETVTRTNNPAALALVIGGGISALVGVILWITGANAIGHDQLVADYGKALNGLDATSPAIDADQAMIWWGIALVALGVLMALSWLIIRAARR